MVELVGVSKSAPPKLAVVRVTVRNIGRTIIKHADSKLRIFPIRRYELEDIGVETGSKGLEIAEAESSMLEVKAPFSPVYIIPGSSGRPLHPSGEYPFVMRPNEQMSVDIPVAVSDLSVVALKVVSSFHCTDTERIRVRQNDGRPKRRRAQYGVRSQYVFDLTSSVVGSVH
jgi:hypothetical protein